MNFSALKTTFFGFIFLFAFNANAQQAATGGRVFGKLIDAANSQPLSFATVSLVRKSDNHPEKAIQTDIDGNFNLTGIDNGLYIFRANYVGYLTFTRDTLTISATHKIVKLGVIKLGAAKGLLKEVQVTAQRSQIQLGVDKKSFSVEQSLVSQGGSATDLLANVPSVQVDADGNISLRGSNNVRVLINGKPSALTGNDLTDILQSIPASSIQTIEVITNPSSKYDAEGDSGIINIILKDNVQQGFTGSASATAGTHNSYNATLNLAYQNKKINVYTNYSFRRADRIGNGYSDKTTRFANGHDTLQNQVANQKFVFSGQNIRSGIDYNIDPKTTISFSDNINIRDRDRYQNGITQIIGDNNVTQIVNQNNYSPDKGTNLDFNLDFDHKFKKKDEELTANIGYSTSHDNGYDYLNTMYDNTIYSNNAPLTDYSYLQDDHTVGHQHNLNLQADYTLPLKNGKWDMGYRSTINVNDNNFVADTSASANNPFNYDGELSNDFIYHEQVHAVYSDFQHTFGKFSVQGGLRLEDALISSQLTDTTSTQKHNDDYLRLYPSLFLTEKISDSQTLQLSYSRRVTRPRGQQISPFLNKSDPLNYQVGNPDLAPEDTHSFELSYINYWKTLTLTSSLYYRLTYDNIEQIRSAVTPEISLTEYENVGSSSNAGYELIAKLSPSSIFDLTGNLNIYYQYIAADPTLGFAKTSGYAWNGNITANIKPFKKLSFQLRGDYQAPQVVPQGKMYAIYGIDGGVRYDITKKFNISVNGRDLLNTRKYGSEIQYSNPEFNTDQYSQRRFSTGVVMATLSYRFGSATQKAKKPKNTDQQPDNDTSGGNPDDSGNNIK